MFSFGLIFFKVERSTDRFLVLFMQGPFGKVFEFDFRNLKLKLKDLSSKLIFLKN